MIYVYHHLGLGDHIVCNGLVRHLCKEHGNVSLFCYKHNEANLKYMYRDNPNITLVPMNSDNEIDNFLNTINAPFVKIGFNKMGDFYNGHSFDEAFYKIADLPFSVRYDEFYLQRDDELETFVYNELNPNNEKYIFIQDDESRGFKIDENKFRQDLKIIRNDKRFNIFEMIKIYENAEEIHFMESSISALVNSLLLPKVKIHMHKYIRNYDHFGYSKSRNNIIMID